MSITDELRKVAAKTECANGRCEKLYRGDLEHIADRIDVEHDKALNSVDDAYDSGYNVGYDEGFASADDWLAQHEDAMAEHGWIRLPKDADGEYIHVGERVQLIGNDPSTVSHMSLADDGWRVYVKYDGGIGTGSGEPKYIRHYHAPTVEDVLREFGDWYAHTKGGCDEDGIIAEYAAKLRLAEEEEE